MYKIPVPPAKSTPKENSKPDFVNLKEFQTS
jgi:hypothetical protein